MMIRSRIPLIFAIGLILPALSHADWLDYFRSASGVYTWEKKWFMKTELEEIDIRSDNTFVWKMTTRLQFPDQPERDFDSQIRGRWTSSGTEIRFFVGEDTSGDPFRTLRQDGGDLVEDSGLKKRYAKRK